MELVMTLKAALFVDVPRIFQAVKERKPGKRLNYEWLYNFIKKDFTLIGANAYGSQMGNEAQHFITALKKIGYRPHYQKAVVIGEKPDITATDSSVVIAIDALKILTRVDVVVICSDDLRLAPLIQHIKSAGIRVIIYSVTDDNQLTPHADESVGIPDDLYEEKIGKNHEFANHTE